MAGDDGVVFVAGQATYRDDANLSATLSFRGTVVADLDGDGQVLHQRLTTGALKG